MGIVFGPVPSRRYGLSLGIDVVPLKTCTFSCVYCEVGRTTNLTIERAPFFTLEDLKKELSDVLVVKGVKPDYITFAGSGEPTLNSEIGRMIRFIKREYPDYPIVVLTNGSLLWMKEVREALLPADVVEASLDTAVDEEYSKLNRHHKALLLDLYLSGLEAFRKDYSGKYVIEVLFVKGINDTHKNIESLKEAIKRISPDMVHLNTVVRPPAEKGTEPVEMKYLEYVKEKLGSLVEVETVFHGSKIEMENIKDMVYKALVIRPMTIKDLLDGFDVSDEELKDIIKDMKDRGIVQEVEYNGKKYLQGIRHQGSIS